MKKVLRVFKIVIISLSILVCVFILGLFIYTRGSYKPLYEMYDEIEQLDLTNIEIIDDFNQISYVVDQPKKNIIIVPGGKVKPQSYQYLAASLALSGYDVMIVKTLFNLAVLTPNYGSRFIKDDIDNVVIGHSLGGTVASVFSQGDDRITEIIFLASYPISDVSDKEVLIITAEFDEVLDMSDVQNSTDYLPSSYVLYQVTGGNHAQFGWYGPQKDDGTSLITTKEQQDIIINQVLDFIQ